MGSQAKDWKRCPACGEVKLIERRSETCSIKCGHVLRKMRMSAEADTAEAQTPEKTLENRIEGDTWQVSLPKTRIRTLEELIEFCKIDTRVWTVERFIANKWEMGAVLGGEDGDKVHVEPLYQIKAWFKRNRAAELAISELEAMRSQAPSWAPKFSAHKVKEGENLLEICLSDLHVGRYAWGQETMRGDYDSRIALQRMRETMGVVLSRAKSFNPSKILLVVGNDLFNIDNLDGATTRGTRQDTDTRYHKLFMEVREAYCEAVAACAEIAPVDVIVVPGNHDTLSSWHLGDSLRVWFSRSRGVTVDNGPSPRKYYRWGSVGLMFCHGHAGKRINYPMVFAAERPDIFGQCTWREVHTGHWHHTIVEDRYGVVVRVLPTLAAESHWESENMYVGSVRAAEAFIWSKDLGLIGTVVHYIKRGE